MPLAFEPIDLDRQAEYLEFLDACPVKSSDYSFVNLWSWAEVYGLRWAWTSKLVWIRQTYPQEVFWAPVGAWNQVNWEEAELFRLKQDVSFIRVPEVLATLWQAALGDRVFAEASRSQWDYLYSVAELVTLKGNRFHKKKNLVNQFRKTYDHVYLPLTDALTDSAAGMQESWCTWRDCESNEALADENTAISKVLGNWRKLKRLRGGAILAGSTMVAYTVAEHLADDTLLIHFEKGNSEYKGVYQAVNQMFLEKSGQDFQWVNREQDLGDEGLRKAKLSYCPIDFLKKYSVRIARDGPTKGGSI